VAGSVTYGQWAGGTTGVVGVVGIPHLPATAAVVAVAATAAVQAQVDTALQSASLLILSQAHMVSVAGLTVSAEAMMTSINTRMNYFIIKVMNF